MSKKSKRASHERNKLAKRARKQANRLRYQSMAESGDNSKRVGTARKRRSNLKGTHPFTPCGNLACKRCYERTESGIHRKKTVVTPTAKKKRRAVS